MKMKSRVLSKIRTKRFRNPFKIRNYICTRSIGIMAKKQKSRAWKIILVVLISSISVMLGFMVYDWWLQRRAHFVRYSQFGIEIPIRYSIHGIDVSKYQNVIDWESVRQMKVNDVQINFAFIKATEGLGNEDALFQRNW